MDARAANSMAEMPREKQARKRAERGHYRDVAALRYQSRIFVRNNSRRLR